MEVVYKLWKSSWQDDAAVRDVANRIYARGDRGPEISHPGQHFKMRGVHLSEPSPQRTPVLFQAGGSERGRRFAATHAEGVYLNGTKPELVAAQVARVKQALVDVGRSPDSVKFFAGVSIFVDETVALAQARYA